VSQGRGGSGEETQHYVGKNEKKIEGRKKKNKEQVSGRGKYLIKDKGERATLAGGNYKYTRI